MLSIPKLNKETALFSKSKTVSAGIQVLADSITSLVEGNETYTDPMGNTTTSRMGTLIKQTVDNVLIKATRSVTTAAGAGQAIIESFINVAPESVKIAASHVDIEGAAIFTSGKLKKVVTSSSKQWYSSTSPDTKAGGSWSTDQPSVAAGRYLWERTLYNYSDGTSEYRPSEGGACVTPRSEAVTDVDVEYADSTSPTSAPSSGWSTTAPTWKEGHYIWQRTMTVTATGTSYSQPTCISGRDGAAGRSVTVTNVEYGTSASASAQPTSWSTTAPTSIAKGVWLWIRTTYSDGSTSTSKSYNGTDGQDGTAAYTYSINCNPASCVRAASGTLTPSSVTFSATRAQGAGNPSVYAGRFVISEYDGSSWTNKYTSSSNESSKSYSPTSTAKVVRCNLYLAGGTSTLLDTQSVPVVSNGANGTNGTNGKDGKDGASVTVSKIEYGVANDASTAPTYSTTVPTSIAKGRWLWVRTTYSNGSTAVNKSYVGTDGEDGTSIYVTSSTKSGGTTTVKLSDGTTMTINDGEDGANGTAGKNGYVHTAWANSSDGSSGFSTTVSANKLYLGVYTDNTAADSTDYTKYSWSLIKGNDGAKGADGADGADAYTVMLTNESHTFAASPTAAIASSATSQVIAYKGTTQVAATIGTVTGAPTGMTVSITNNGKTNAGLTVAVTTSLTTRQGVLTIPVTVDGKAFSLRFSWSLALAGADGADGLDGRNLATKTSDAVSATSTGSNLYVTRHYLSAYGTGVTTNDTTSHYTLSFDWTCADMGGNPPTEGQIRPYVNAASWGAAIPVSTGGGHVAVTRKLTSEQATSEYHYVRVRMLESLAAGYVVTVSNVKFERGDHETGWSIAPEDVKAIGEVREEYYLSSSATERKDGEWLTEPQKYVTGWYYWTRSKITWSDGSVTTSAPMLAKDITSIADVANASVKTTTQLWFTKADDVAPAKPTAKVTSTSKSGNAWRVVVPNYNSNYPNYFYCWQYESMDGSYTWSDVVFDLATTENFGQVRGAQARSQLIYHSVKASVNELSQKTTWVTNTTGNQNVWTVKRPTYSSDYPVLFLAQQAQTVAQMAAGSACSCTDPMKDDTTTIIDGGHITTGEIDASKVSVTNIDAGNIKSGSIDAGRIAAGSIEIGKLSTSLQNTISALDRATAYRGVCSTDATTRAKAVTCTGFELADGAVITVYNTTAQTYASGSLTLNVNNTGAKTVYVGDTATSATNRMLWAIGSSITYVYKSGRWYVADSPGTWMTPECMSGSNMVVKEVTCPACVIINGTTLKVPMRYHNNETAPQVDVQSLGAANLYFGSAAVVPTMSNGFSWKDYSIADLVFDGQYWRTGNKTYISGGDIVTGTIDTRRLDANTIKSEIVQATEINASQITAGTISSDRIDTATITAGVANVIEIDASRIKSGTISSDRIDTSSIASKVINALEITGDKIKGGTIEGVTIKSVSGSKSATLLDSKIEFRYDGSLKGLIEHYGGTGISIKSMSSNGGVINVSEGLIAMGVGSHAIALMSDGLHVNDGGTYRRGYNGGIGGAYFKDGICVGTS